MTPSVGTFLDLFYFVFLAPDNESAFSLTMKNYSAYENYNLTSTLYYLKSYKCMFTDANHQVNNLPETGLSEKE